MKTITKRAADLTPGDVLDDLYLPNMRVLAVRGPYGSPAWVTVDFDPVGHVAYNPDQLVTVRVEA